MSGIHSPSLSHDEPLRLLLGSVQMSLPLLISRFIPWPLCPSGLGTFSLALTFSEVAQSCPTLSDPTDCSLPGSSVHGIFQARVLEWVAISFSSKSAYSPALGNRHQPARPPGDVVLEGHWPSLPSLFHSEKSM